MPQAKHGLPWLETGSEARQCWGLSVPFCLDPLYRGWEWDRDKPLVTGLSVHFANKLRQIILG